MSSWIRGAGFRIVGFVDKAFVPPSKKVAFLTVAVPGNGKEQKIECRTFDGEMIRQVGALGVGETVHVTGRIEKEVLRYKREDVLAGGKPAWVIALTIREIQVQGATARPLTQPADGAKGEAPPASSAPATRDWEKDDAEKGVIW